MTRTLRLSMILATVLTTSTAAHAEGGSISINARVRTVCTAEIKAAPFAMFEKGLNRVGELIELCNSVEGYRLVVKHSEMSQGAYWLLDGIPIDVEKSSDVTVLVDSTQPAYRQRHLALYLPEPISERFPLVLYAEPKGMVF